MLRQRKNRSNNVLAVVVASCAAFGNVAEAMFAALRGGGGACSGTDLVQRSGTDLVQRVKEHCTQVTAGGSTASWLKSMSQYENGSHAFAKTLHKHHVPTAANKDPWADPLKEVLDGIQRAFEHIYFFHHLPDLGQTGQNQNLLKCYRKAQEKIIDHVYPVEQRYGAANVASKTKYAIKNIKDIMNVKDLTQETCPISMERLVDLTLPTREQQDTIQLTNCGHFFHRRELTCLLHMTWIASGKSSCPQCRQQNPTVYDLPPYFLPDLVQAAAGEDKSVRCVAFAVALQKARAKGEDEISVETKQELETKKKLALGALSGDPIALQQMILSLVKNLPKVTSSSAQQWQATWQQVLANVQSADDTTLENIVFQKAPHVFKQLLERLLPAVAADVAEADFAAAVFQVQEDVDSMHDNFALTQDFAREILRKQQQGGQQRPVRCQIVRGQRIGDLDRVPAHELAWQFAAQARTGQVQFCHFHNTLLPRPEVYQRTFWVEFFAHQPEMLVFDHAEMLLCQTYRDFLSSFDQNDHLARLRPVLKTQMDINSRAEEREIQRFAQIQARQQDLDAVAAVSPQQYHEPSHGTADSAAHPSARRVSASEHDESNHAHGWYTTPDNKKMIYWYEGTTKSSGGEGEALTKYYKWEDVNKFVSTFDYGLHPEHPNQANVKVFISDKNNNSQWMPKDYVDFTDRYNKSGDATRYYPNLPKQVGNDRNHVGAAALKRLQDGFYPHFEQHDDHNDNKLGMVDFFFTEEHIFHSRPSKWKHAEGGCYVYDDEVFAEPGQLRVYYNRDELESALAEKQYGLIPGPDGFVFVVPQAGNQADGIILGASSWDIPDDVKSSLMPQSAQ